MGDRIQRYFRTINDSRRKYFKWLTTFLCLALAVTLTTSAILTLSGIALTDDRTDEVGIVQETQEEAALAASDGSVLSDAAEGALTGVDGEFQSDGETLTATPENETPSSEITFADQAPITVGGQVQEIQTENGADDGSADFVVSENESNDAAAADGTAGSGEIADGSQNGGASAGDDSQGVDGQNAEIQNPDSQPTGEGADGMSSFSENLEEHPLPAQIFEAVFTDLTVHVETPEGAFPAGVTMTVTPIHTEDISAQIENAVASEVQQVQAVDISFYDKDGFKIEPLLPIRVVMQSTALGNVEKPEVVHISDEGISELVSQIAPEVLAEEKKLKEQEEALPLTSEEAELAEEVIADQSAKTAQAVDKGIAVQGVKKQNTLEQILSIFNGDEGAENAGTQGPSAHATDSMPTADSVTSVPAGDSAASASPADSAASLSEPVVTADDILSVRKAAEEAEMKETLPVAEVNFDAEHFSIYAIVGKLENNLLTTDGQTYRVSINYTEEAQIPEGSVLFVGEVFPEDYDNYTAAAAETLGTAPQSISYARFFDLTIWKDGEEVHPAAPVDVKISLLTEDALENENNAETTAQVVHFGPVSEVIVPETGVTTDTQEKERVELAFEAGGFSVYGVVYTVDFEYSVNGQMYDFSLPGGGFVSFTDLVEVLGIIGDTNTEQNGDETGSVIAENNEENAANEGAEENSVNSDTNTSLTLGGVEVSETTRNFVADVTSVEFSNSELVDVSRVEADTTVGQIKDSRGLECEYSAELTEEQIAEINAQTVEAGDWALISVQPFTSEETLTVTMKNGDQFLVKVTDAQISTHVITTKGEHFRITVTYDEDAKIPDGSKLVAREILEGTEEYEKYLEDAAIEWEEAEREGFISYARFFDLEIQKDGKKIEPEAPVEVEIDHEEGFTLGIDESLSVIHFAQKGTEIIDELHRNEDGTEVIYEQNGFSVIGTVSTVKDSGWPTANGQYVLVLQDGDDYYALKQDGTLTKIRYFNNTVSFIGEGTTTTDYIDDYLWYVQSYSGANARGRISDKYYESGSVEDQMFIVPTQNGWLANSATQIRFNSTERKLYYTYYNVSRTLSAHNGQLNVVNLDDPSGSPIFFASVSSFTANDNETDLFTQEEVESIISKWREQKTQESTYDKTAEVYDYENRVYQVDITASSADYEVAPSIALEFVVDASRSMFFPTSVNQVGTFNGTNASNVRDWINANGNTDQIYFVIQNKNGAATQYAIFYDPNSEYEVNHGWWTETKYGQWLWCDASVYNPPDDVSNGGDNNSMQSGLPLSEWNWGNMDDGKIYTTDITGTSDGTYGTRKTWVSRIEYLKQCARVASQVIYAVDENAQIGLIGFNASVTDYGTFGKSDQQALLNNIDNISLAGGTNHQAGLQTAIDKYQDQDFYAQHYAGRKHVVVLVTDGAPNQSGVNWTTIGTVATNLKNLEDDFGHKTELYTMGLSLTNVGSNQSNLFNISSGTGYTYAGEDAAQIINAVTKIVDGIFVQANLVADVTDVIDPAFYPVNKADGRPLAEDDWINLNGTKVSSGANDAAGQIKKDPSTGNWYVEWKGQSIDWPTTDSNGAVTEPGWHGTVFVKAKEDFLGGNGISTNAEGSQLEATKYIVRGETEQHDLPQGDHTTSFETPYVNVDELDITNNDTEWTVYLGTNVDPLTEVKALWEKVKIKEVVTKTDSDHRMSSDGSLTYQYAANTNDNRDETNGREEFSISDLEITLTEDDWTDLIAGNSKTFTYSAYNHSSVGTIMISLTQAVAEGEKNLTESPHDTTVTGDEVEKYTLTVSYRPKGANITNWHTGSYGSGMAGIRAGNISKDNTHIINVYVKGLQITKVDLNDQVLPGAKFALYRSARTGETDLLEIDGEQYFKVAELDTSSTGIAVKEQIEQLEEGEQYYLVETEVPAGYIVISPIPVNLNISDIYTPKPGTTTQTTKPDSGIYDWTQNASLVLNAESGVKRTNADNTADLTHSAVTANSDMETIYYRITNNPGVELPSTGGPGTRLFTILGSILIFGAGVLLWRRRRLI